MLVPIEKIEKPFQALGHAVSNIVRPQASPQQTPTAQPPAKAAAPPSVADRVQAWQSLIGTYYTDEAIRARHMQDLEQSEKEAEAEEKKAGAKIQPQLWQQELAAGELTKKQAEEKEQDRKDLSQAYQNYVDAKPADKEAARQKLIALESVISMKPLTDTEELQRLRLEEEIREHNLMHQDRTATLNERMLTDRYNREKKAEARATKSTTVFQKALTMARNAAVQQWGSGTPVTDTRPGSASMQARAQWQQQFNDTMLAYARKEYDTIQKLNPDLNLPPLPEGENSNWQAYKIMQDELLRSQQGQAITGLMSPQLGLDTNVGAESAADANQWYVPQ